MCFNFSLLFEMRHGCYLRYPTSNSEIHHGGIISLCIHALYLYTSIGPTPNALLRIAGCPTLNVLLRIAGCPTPNVLLRISVPYFV